MLKFNSIKFCLIAAIVASLLIACDAHIKYEVQGTTFNHKLTSLGSSYALISVEPGNDQVFYFTGVYPKNEYQPGSDDWRFMLLTMDSLNRAYLDWRSKLLKKGEDYISPFSSKYLEFGKSEKRFINLKPDTDYFVFSCAVNPVTQESVGQPSFSSFHTKYPISSSLLFNVDVRPNGYVMIRPSNQRDQYSFLTLSEKDMENNIYYIEDLIYQWALGASEADIHHGDLASNINNYLDHDGNYYICVFGWDGGFTTAINYIPFKWPVKE